MEQAITQKRQRLPERHEKKYWINQGDMLALRQKLLPALEHDEYADKYGRYFPSATSTASASTICRTGSFFWSASAKWAI